MAKLNIVWNGNSKGNGVIEAEKLKTNLAIPESLGGSGKGTDHKELLLASAASCYMTTLVYMLETKKLPVTEFTMNSEASNSKQDGLKIVHYPQITLAANATEEQTKSVNRAIDSANKSCAVGNILKKADAQITIEGNVSVSS